VWVHFLTYKKRLKPSIIFHLVANTKHLPQGVFPDKNGKYPDETSTEEDEQKTLSAILFKQSLKHLDESKGQKPQTGTKPVTKIFDYIITSII